MILISQILIVLLSGDFYGAEAVRSIYPVAKKTIDTDQNGKGALVLMEPAWSGKKVKVGQKTDIEEDLQLNPSIVVPP